MCGIVVVFGQGDARSSQQNLRTDLEKSLDYIVHRGPDASDVWISDDASCGLFPFQTSTEAIQLTEPGLGHCRLAINDLSPDGEQPLHSPDGLVHAVVNGEIYDYDKIRLTLLSTSDGQVSTSTSSGYKFRGHSDSELVLALYLTHGLAFFPYLRGEFAIVIYDQRPGPGREKLLAIRDRFGIKPLFYTRVGESVAIAAEIKAFQGLAGWKPEWDVGALIDGGWGQDDRTVFKGVRKVRPGQFMLLERGRSPTFKQYWDPEYPNKVSRIRRGLDRATLRSPARARNQI